MLRWSASFFEYCENMRKSDKAFIYVSLGGIKGISSRRELNVFASQSQQFDLFLIGLLDLLSRSCLNYCESVHGKGRTAGTLRAVRNRHRGRETPATPRRCRLRDPSVSLTLILYQVATSSCPRLLIVSRPGTKRWEGTVLQRRRQQTSIETPSRRRVKQCGRPVGSPACRRQPGV